MIVKIHHCHECGSIHIVRNGKTKKGSPRYLCKDCGITRVIDPSEQYGETTHKLAIKAYQDRSSLRGVGRIFGISHQTVFNWVKKN